MTACEWVSEWVYVCARMWLLFAVSSCALLLLICEQCQLIWTRFLQLRKNQFRLNYACSWSLSTHRPACDFFPIHFITFPLYFISKFIWTCTRARIFSSENTYRQLLFPLLPQFSSFLRFSVSSFLRVYPSLSMRSHTLVYLCPTISRNVCLNNYIPILTRFDSIE